MCTPTIRYAPDLIRLASVPPCRRGAGLKCTHEHCAALDEGETMLRGASIALLAVALTACMESVPTDPVSFAESPRVTDSGIALQTTWTFNPQDNTSEKERRRRNVHIAGHRAPRSIAFASAASCVMEPLIRRQSHCPKTHLIRQSPFMVLGRPSPIRFKRRKFNIHITQVPVTVTRFLPIGRMWGRFGRTVAPATGFHDPPIRDCATLRLRLRNRRLRVGEGEGARARCVPMPVTVKLT